MDRSNTLVLFDIDGTLSESRLTMKPEMKEFLADLRKKVTIGVVGGSDMPKQMEQLGEDCTSNFDYNFPENGCIAYENGKLVSQQSIATHMGEEKLKEFINYTLALLSRTDCPKKRGNFIEFRTGMINICPVGRNCSYEERLEFFEYDKKHHVRENIVKELEAKFVDLKLKFSIGGQISLDVFPIGWDKTFCLRHVEKKNFTTIHFFGDKTMPGGNDYEIFSHPKVTGHTVKSPEDTLAQCQEIFFNNQYKKQKMSQ